MGGERLSITVIVPTMNRPRDLRRCLASILRQARPPTEVIVVDDGADDEAELRSLFEGSGIAFAYLKKDARGLCGSRNVGVRLSTGSIIVFLDDDTELDEGYILAYAEVFEGDPERKIGGLSGRPTRYRNGVQLPADHVLSWEERLQRFFLLSSAHGGRVLPSGYRSSVVNPKGRVRVEFLQGGNMALRREVFEEFSFDESLDRLSSYPPGEDVMFTYPVSRRYELYAIEDARMKHFHTSGGRPNRRKLARSRVIHQHRFLHELMDPSLTNRVAFGWAMVGLVVTHALAVVLLGLRGRNVRPQISALRGVLSGIGHVLTNPAPKPAHRREGLLPRE